MLILQNIIKFFINGSTSQATITMPIMAPTAELVGLSTIVGDKDKAEAIVKAIGDVKYKVGYKPALNTEKDSIYLAFDPKPLTLQLPAAVEGQEGQTVTVTISSPDKGSFAYKKNQLKLKLSADKVELAGVAVPVPQTLFDFDMTKKK